MKGLIFAFGLIPALFLSIAQASIFDTSTYLPPKTDSLDLGYCDSAWGTDLTDVTQDACPPHVYSIMKSTLNNPWTGDHSAETNGRTYYYSDYSYAATGGSSGTQTAGHWRYTKTLTNESCPPELNDQYIYSYDSNNDGKIDKCFNPLELDNASNCASSANGGNLLPLGTNNSNKVCASSNDGSGAVCGYSQVSAGNSTYYMVDLEINCFGDSDVPPYDPEPNLEMPQPEECKPYGDGFVCASDPSDQCDSNSGVCNENCGYVNNQFVCFRDVNCAAAICENPPVVDPNNPDPDPNNPDPDPDPNNPDPDNPVGGGGGGTFSIDYAKLGDLMKDAAKTLVDENEMPDSKDVTDSITDAETDITTAYDDFFNSNVFDEIIDKPNEGLFDEMKTMNPGGGR